MRKFALAAVAVLAATVSLSNVAEAHRHHDDEDWNIGRHHNDGDWGRHDDWGRRDVDVIVFRRPDCSMTKIIKETDWGTKVIFVRRCD